MQQKFPVCQALYLYFKTQDQRLANQKILKSFEIIIFLQNHSSDNFKNVVLHSQQ